MAARKGGLGKGLDTLIPPKKNETTKEVEKVEIKKIEEYVRNQMQQDLEYDQMSLKEYIDPFTGEPVKKNKK